MGALDDHGFVLTGLDAVRSDSYGEGAGQRPSVLETNRPDVLAAGDVRSGSTKRVASAVGEGAIAVSLVHQNLEESTDYI